MARNPSTSADMPATPADLEQRQGRAIRGGNTLNIVQIFYYFAARPSQQRPALPMVAPADDADTAEEVLP